MPKKLDLSDRYARGQRHHRRRAVTRPLEDLDPQSEPRPESVVAVAEPAVVTPATPRTPSRQRTAALQNYHYIRSDLIQIGIVTAIVLAIMLVLFFVLR